MPQLGGRGVATLVAVARSGRGGGELKTAVASAGVSSAANLLAFVTLRSSPACLCATHTHRTLASRLQSFTASALCKFSKRAHFLARFATTTTTKVARWKVAKL